MKYVDLHIHTHYSDGLDTPSQIVKMARIKGLDMIAITDHDNLRGYFKALPEARAWGVELVPGVEITTVEHHLLALNFDPRDQGFANFIQRSQDIQREVCRQRVELLKAHGLPITFNKVQRAYSRSTLGKFSILMTMLSDKACKDYLERRHGKLGMSDLFKLYLATKGVAGKIEKRKVITWKQAIREIHKANGLAVFPHPPTMAKDPSEMLDMLVGIDGIEIQLRYEKRYRPFQDYARREGLFVTYGSDFHSSAFGYAMLGRRNNALDEEVLEEIKK